MTEYVIPIITLLVGSGGMGIFNYLSKKRQLIDDNQRNTTSEWMALYTEVRSELQRQQDENSSLRDSIHELQTQVNNLQIELQTYKNYETYIVEQDKYISHILHTLKSLTTEEAYKSIEAKKPIRILDTPTNSDEV